MVKTGPMNITSLVKNQNRRKWPLKIKEARNAAENKFRNPIILPREEKVRKLVGECQRLSFSLPSIRLKLMKT